MPINDNMEERSMHSYEKQQLADIRSFEADAGGGDVNGPIMTVGMCILVCREIPVGDSFLLRGFHVTGNDVVL
jgi:hypothetical protein